MSYYNPSVNVLALSIETALLDFDHCRTQKEKGVADKKTQAVFARTLAMTRMQ